MRRSRDEAGKNGVSRLGGILKNNLEFFQRALGSHGALWRERGGQIYAYDRSFWLLCGC